MEAKFREILENLEAKNDLSPELENELLAKIKGGTDPLEPPPLEPPLVDPLDPIIEDTIVTVDPITGEVIITTVSAMGGVT